MTNKLRKNQAGQPTTNGGEFAAKTHADADDVSLETLVAMFPHAEDGVLRLDRDDHDEEGYTVSNSAGKTVSFRAAPNTTPEALIAEAREFWAEDEFGDDEDEDLTLFVFEHNGYEYEVEYAGGDSFWLYQNGQRAATFTYLGDVEDHSAVEEAAAQALDAEEDDDMDPEDVHEQAVADVLYDMRLRFPDAKEVIYRKVDAGGHSYLTAAEIRDQDGTALWVSTEAGDADEFSSHEGDLDVNLLEALGTDPQTWRMRP